MQESNRKVTVFVKSIRTVALEEFRDDYLRPTAKTVLPRSKEVRRLKNEFVLSEDQQEIVSVVKQFARSYGFEVEVVDVTRENFLRRDIQEHAKHIHKFPTIITDDGRRIEGNITKQQLEALLTHEHKYL
jgi:predicted DsbA family dithiol-disulfide isomerase